MADAAAPAGARELWRRVRRDGAYANLTLAGELARARLEPRERGLATELVYGVLRHRRRLDHCIAAHSDRPLSRVEDDLLDAMRVAAYQLLLLRRVPAHAAVNDAVEAVRRGRGKGPAGYANAVLRKVAHAELDTNLPDEPVLQVALRGSLPTWLAKRWLRRLGAEEAAALAASLLERAPLTVRTNLARGTLEALEESLAAEGASVTRGRLVPGALHLEGMPDPFRSATYLEGLWTVQDEAAQLAALMLDPQPDETVLDACAGVGGKATHLAALMQDRGQVVCADRSQRKLELLQEHAMRLGLTICAARPGDLLAPGALDDVTADRVLVDAPCSGLGVLRRHPELKWRAERPDFDGLVRLQRQLLERAVGALRPGGVLVYAVCTMTRAEGPEQAKGLVERHPDLRQVAPPPALAALAGPDGALTLWPHRHGCDGFYLARFAREG